MRSSSICFFPVWLSNPDAGRHLQGVDPKQQDVLTSSTRQRAFRDDMPFLKTEEQIELLRILPQR